MRQLEVYPRIRLTTSDRSKGRSPDWYYRKYKYYYYLLRNHKMSHPGQP